MFCFNLQENINAHFLNLISWKSRIFASILAKTWQYGYLPCNPLADLWLVDYGNEDNKL